MNLQEIATTWGAIDDALEASGGEITPEIEAQLDAISLAEKAKVDHTIFYCKSLEGDAQHLKKVADEILAKARAKEKRRDWLLGRVKDYMTQRKTDELAGDIFRFALVKSGKRAVEVLVDPKDLPHSWRITEYRANKELIREQLESLERDESDEYAHYARLAEPTLSLRVY